MPPTDRGAEHHARLAESRSHTSLAKAEQELRESEARYRALAESSPLAIFVNRGDKVLLANPACVQLFGASSPEELIGRPALDLFDPDSRSLVSERIRVDSETVPLVEVRIVRLDGTAVDVEATASPFLDQGGEAIQILLRDITGRKRAEEESRRTSAFLGSLIDNGNAPIIVWGPDLRITRFNHAFERLTRQSADEVVGRPLDILFPSASREASLATIGLAGQGESLESTEIEILRADGDVRTVLWSSAPVYDTASGNTLLAVIAQGQDITERKRAEQELRESEARFRALAESSPLAIFVNRDDKVFLANPACVQLFGASSPEDLIGKPALELFDPDSRSLISERIRVDSETLPLVEVRIVRLDGTTVDVEATASPFLDQGVKAIQILLRDITGRKRAEEELRKSEDRFRYVFHHSGVAKCITRPSGEIEVNDAFLEMVGYSREELGEHGTWQQLTHPDDIARSEQVVASVISGERNSARFEKRYLRKDGSVVWGDVSTALRRHSDGSPDYFMTAIIDITERKHAEQELLALTEDLARSNAELEKFAYIASHDLQEPLRMVASYVQLLQRRYQGRLDSDADEFIAYAVDGATRMQTLINDLLAYSRVGTQVEPPSPTDLETVFGDVLQVLEQTIADAGATVTHDPLPVMSCDSTQIGRVFQNLITNAIKFRRDEPPRVHVSASRADGEWVLSVSDNGIGIDPQYFDRIFIIFQRLQPRPEYSGTGMGLAICKRIIQRHAGRIWVESEPGVGSTFYFALPDGREA